MLRHLLVPVAAIVGAMAWSSSAQAVVLVEAPARSLTTSGCLSVGIWYQSYSGGSRRATITVSKGGTRRYKRTFRATTSWRYITPLCGKLEDLGPGTYTTRITTGGRTVAYRTRVRVTNH